MSCKLLDQLSNLCVYSNEESRSMQHWCNSAKCHHPSRHCGILPCLTSFQMHYSQEGLLEVE